MILSILTSIVKLSGQKQYISRDTQFFHQSLLTRHVQCEVI